MRFNSAIHLITTTSVENDIGDLIQMYQKREIFAEKKSVRQSEFYQAAVTGLKPEITFVTWSREYKNEEKLEYNGKEYHIIRTFDNGEKTELICAGLVNS